MITLDTFYQEMQQNFRDINAKIDKVEVKVDDLCTRTAVVETKYKEHVKEEVKNSDKKYKYISVFVGIAAILSAAYNTLFKP